MTMKRVVLHHTYRNGRATDVSGFSNHGLAHDTYYVGGGDPWNSALRFDGGASEVRVPRSDTLVDLDAIRLRVRFLWRPGDANEGRRHNLVEGHLSFALFLTDHGGIMGTIVDATGHWRGVGTGPGAVAIAEWHEAELRHDGFSTLTVHLDGAVVAAAYDVPGPVRSVGPNGIAIGHWPEPDPRYTLIGFIGDVLLAHRKIEPEDLLDGCCTDMKTVDETLAAATEAGLTKEQAREALGKVRRIEAELRAKVADGDPDRARKTAELSVQGTAAMASGDVGAIAAALTRSAQHVLEKVSEAEVMDYGQRAVDAVRDLPYGDVLAEVFDGRTFAPLHRVKGLPGAFCLPDPGEKPPPRPPKRRPPDPEGDPHTDLPDGSRPPLVDDLEPQGDDEYPVDEPDDRDKRQAD